MTARSTKSAAKTTTSKKTKSTKANVAKTGATAKPTSALKETVDGVTKPALAAGLIKKQELMDRVVAETGMKKKDVKPVVEAMVEVMTKALVNGEEFQVPPLGKLKIQKVKEVPNAKIITLKLRHSTVPKPPKATLLGDRED